MLTASGFLCKCTTDYYCHFHCEALGLVSLSSNIRRIPPFSEGPSRRRSYIRRMAPFLLNGRCI